MCVGVGLCTPCPSPLYPLLPPVHPCGECDYLSRCYVAPARPCPGRAARPECAWCLPLVPWCVACPCAVAPGPLLWVQGSKSQNSIAADLEMMQAKGVLVEYPAYKAQQGRHREQPPCLDWPVWGVQNTPHQNLFSCWCCTVVYLIVAFVILMAVLLS